MCACIQQFAHNMGVFSFTLRQSGQFCLHLTPSHDIMSHYELDTIHRCTVHTHIRIHTTHIHTLYIYVCTYVHTYTCTTYVHRYIHTYVYTHMYTHNTHTYIQCICGHLYMHYMCTYIHTHIMYAKIHS